MDTKVIIMLSISSFMHLVDIPGLSIASLAHREIAGKQVPVDAPQLFGTTYVPAGISNIDKCSE